MFANMKRTALLGVIVILALGMSAMPASAVEGDLIRVSAGRCVLFRAPTQVETGL